MSIVERLTEEEKEKLISDYYRDVENDDYNEGYKAALRKAFGNELFIKPKPPKTWSELINSEYYTWDEVIGHLSTKEYPIYKSMFALLKIHQLIEASYGGNITDAEWDKSTQSNYDVFGIVYSTITKSLEVRLFSASKSIIAFHTYDQAEEFLSYPENVQLLRDYFMITYEKNS